MKKIVLASLMMVCLPYWAMAQSVDDDLYFIPKKKAEKKEEVKKEVKVVVPQKQNMTTVYAAPGSTVVVKDVKGKVRDVDEYNRRYTSRENNFSMENDTLYIEEKPLNERGEWVNGFEGSQDDYEYAMRIVRFRNPRYAIPVSSPLYWDVVYGAYPSWDWNVYDDGLYAYAFPTYTNRLWWDWRFNYPYGGGWGLSWGWSSPWYNSWYGPGYWGGYWGASWGWHHHHHHYPHYGWGGGHWGGGHGGWSRPNTYYNDRNHLYGGSRRPSVGGNSGRYATGTRPSRSDGRYTRLSTSQGIISGNRVNGTRPSGGRVVGTRPSSSSVRPGNTVGNTANSGRPSVSGTRPSSSSSFTRPGSSRRNAEGYSRGSSGYNRPSSTRSSVNSNSSYRSSTRSSEYRNSNTVSGTRSSSSRSSYSSGSSSRSGSYSSGGGSSTRSSGGGGGGTSRGSGHRR